MSTETEAPATAPQAAPASEAPTPHEEIRASSFSEGVAAASRDIAKQMERASAEAADPAHAAQLRAAANEANEAAERLEQASHEAEPSPGRTMLNAALWAGTVFAVSWGLNALAHALFGRDEEKLPRRPRGTEDAETEPTLPPPPEGAAMGSAAGAVLVLLLVLLSGCASVRPPPTLPASTAACPQWRSAQAGWEWVDTYVRAVLEQQTALACTTPSPLPPMPPPATTQPPAATAP